MSDCLEASGVAPFVPVPLGDLFRFFFAFDDQRDIYKLAIITNITILIRIVFGAKLPVPYLKQDRDFTTQLSSKNEQTIN